MLYWALVFLIVALVAAALGLAGSLAHRLGSPRSCSSSFLSCFWCPWSPTSPEDPAYPEEDFAWRENTHRARLKTLSARCTNLSVAI